MSSAKSKRAEFLPFMRPVIGDEEIAEVVDTLHSGWLTTGGKARQFEQRFCEEVNAEAALAVNSCTAALHLSLQVLGIKPGDEVITSGFTFAATANVIEQSGALPVLVDVEPDTLNLDPILVEKSITPRTRAVIAVHFAGHPCDMDALQSICDEHQIPLIEDSAHGLGATYKGAKIGSSGNLTAYSFYANKNITTGEGGMLVGPSDYISRARTYSVFGITRDAFARYSAQGEGAWAYDCIYPGLKYNMSDIAASIGIHQLEKLQSFQQHRKELAQFYQTSLAEFEEIQLPTERDSVEHAWHLYSLRLNLAALRIDRATFVQRMRELNIGCSVHFIPLTHHPFYRDHRFVGQGEHSVMDREYERIFSIPMNASLTKVEAVDVVSAIIEIIERYRR